MDSPVDSERQTATYRRHAAMVGIGIFISTLAQTAVMGDLPLRFLLKNRLGVRPESMAVFMQLATLPWQLKLIAGLLSDRFPIRGRRRRPYLLLSGLGAAGFWAAMGLIPRHFGTLLAAAIAMNVFLMIGSTVSGALLVEEGQKHGATGRLSSLRQAVMMTASVVAGPVSGWLAARAFGLTAAIGAGLAFLLIPAAALLVREPRLARAAEGAWARTWDELKRLVRARTLLAAAGLLFLVQISPGFVGAPIFFYQTDVLHFGPEFLGTLLMVGGLTGILGAGIYAWICREMNLRSLLYLSIAISAAGTLIYLAYRSRSTAIAITAVAGLIGSFAQLPLFDLAARATPKGSEAIGYAVMMAVWNLGMSGSDLLGSWLFQHFHLTFMNLVWLNAGTTAAVLVAIPFLPAALVARPEGVQHAGEH